MNKIKKYIVSLIILILMFYSAYMNIKFNSTIRGYETLVKNMTKAAETLNAQRLKAELELSDAREKIAQADLIIEKNVKAEEVHAIEEARERAELKSSPMVEVKKSSAPEAVKVDEYSKVDNKEALKRDICAKKLTAKERAQILKEKVSMLLKNTNFEEKVSDYAAEL